MPMLGCKGCRVCAQHSSRAFAQALNAKLLNLKTQTPPKQSAQPRMKPKDIALKNKGGSSAYPRQVGVLRGHSGGGAGWGWGLRTLTLGRSHLKPSLS